MHYLNVLLIIILFTKTNYAQVITYTLQFEEEVQLARCSFRGAAIDQKMAFVSGSEGKVFKAFISEKLLEWKLISLPNCDSLQFRDVAILDEKTVLLMSAGEGKDSQIWKSTDRGYKWIKVYQNLLDKAFFNGFDFWNKQQGALISDPIDDKVYILSTENAGTTWQRLQSETLPTLFGKEYGFAASGTSIQCFGNGQIRIGTGGETARIFVSINYGKNWTIENTSIIQGNASSGIFSLDFISEKKGLAIGGDYANDTLAGKNLIQLNNTSWNIVESAKNLKYKSCIKYLNEQVILATGTSGTAVSYNAGESWSYLNDVKGYHTIAFDKQNNRGILAGDKGRVLEFWLKK